MAKYKAEADLFITVVGNKSPHITQAMQDQAAWKIEQAINTIGGIEVPGGLCLARVHIKGLNNNKEPSHG